MKVKWTQHILAPIVILLIAVYIFYLRQPSNDWMTPAVVNPDSIRPGDTVRVDFRVKSNRDCALDLARYMEQLTPNGVILFPILKLERKVIRSAPEVRNSFFVVTIPTDTQPGRYRLFSRIRDDCSWLDRIWPRVVDTEAVEITVI